MHRSSNAPLQDDIGVSVCVCMFVKDKDGWLERGGPDLETKDLHQHGRSGLCYRMHVREVLNVGSMANAVPPLVAAQILFSGGLQLITARVQQ